MEQRFSADVVLVTGATGGTGASHVRGYHVEGPASWSPAVGTTPRGPSAG
ncbi:hypothetical protein [Kineococcus aurantiacus]|uniref:Glutamate synthase domain-containing protein 2 n=1 Tax=Kineococcus aurantiacus TaxID=37633 RepID=A0A7Y9J384_9ACTN|nr:hypothetical protein [Kineococcus aurantiacus]NYD24773.1 glutamate synthase domain-containing protein 2 [Kineococcus aurantiacus]